MTTGSSRPTVPCSLAELQTGIKAPPGLVQQLWFELGTDFYSLSLQIQDQYGATPFKRVKKKGRKGPSKVLVEPEIWISLETIILSVSSQCCPKGWQAEQWALCSLRKPAASQRPVDQVIKTLLPLLLVIKYFHAFVNRFSSFNPTGHKKHNFSSLDIPV